MSAPGSLVPAARPTLADVVVLERADRLAVSICGSLLAELGATVLQVPGAAHDIGLTEGARAKAALCSVVGKTAVAVDLGREDGRVAWRRMVERADIVLIGFDGEDDAKLLAQESDRRIVCALSAFGADAPAGARQAGETVLQATGGIMAATGSRSSPSPPP